MKLAVVLFSVLGVASVGCKDDGETAYPNYQMCFDDHTMHEMLPVKEAIVVCCIDHPINGLKIVCGDAKPDCINYLTANLNQTSASTIDVMDACDDYVVKKKM